MKNLGLILFLSILLAACQKNDIPGDNGCISQVKRVNFGIKSSDSVSAIALLKQNAISYSNLQLSFISFDTVKEGPNIGIYQNVFAVQNINSLPVISGDIWFRFENNILQSTTGTRYSPVASFGASALSLPELRKLFLNAAVKNNAVVSFRDSCLVAQFGYYDLNALPGGAPKLVKAWSVSLKTRGSYPQVFIRDIDGSTILYDGGPVLDDALHLKR